VRWKDGVFYAVPAAIAVVAGVLAWRAFHGEGPGVPSQEPPPTALMCPSGRYRCTKNEILATTGEEKTNGSGCDERSVGKCARACVSESVSLDGVDDETGKTQLCDAPINVEPMVAKTLTIVELGDDGGTCVADGWGPSEDGVLECILRSAKDPDALGVVVARVTCRTQPVPTMDKTPRIVGRDEAIAIWCARSNAALIDAGVSADAIATPAIPTIDAGVDADADAGSSDADADADARDGHD
jgi:hypothetical protein